MNPFKVGDYIVFKVKEERDSHIRQVFDTNEDDVFYFVTSDSQYSKVRHQNSYTNFILASKSKNIKKVNKYLGVK